MSEIVTRKVAVTTTGSAGSATGSGISETIHGLIMDIFFDFNGSAPNTTDTTVAFTTRGGNIVVITNSEVDVLVAPRQATVDNTNTAIATTYVPFTCHDTITVSVAGCDALTDAVIVYIKYLTD